MLQSPTDNVDLMRFESFLWQKFCHSDARHQPYLYLLNYITFFYLKQVINLKGKSHELGTCEAKHNTKEEEEEEFFSG